MQFFKIAKLSLRPFGATIEKVNNSVGGPEVGRLPVVVCKPEGLNQAKSDAMISLLMTVY